jgi:hypothetical protein
VTYVVARLCCLDHLIRPQAARADTKASDAAVDDRPHGLQIRLVAPWPHVVRVAVLPANDRALAANLTSFRHKANPNDTAPHEDWKEHEDRESLLYK